MFIIVGLGNPGKKYEYTKHNMGFLTIDILAQRLGVKVNKIKFKGLYQEARIGNEKVILLKPQTYMNLSGESVREIASYYKVDPEKIIVIVDDIDIEFATLKIRKKGSAGTHNGLKSIIYQLQSQDFPRIKIGVGKNKKGEDLADFILGGFSQKEGAEIEKTLEIAADAVEDIVLQGLDYSMNKYNTKKTKTED